MASIRVLLVDDHAILREGIRSLLATDPDLQVVGEAGDGSEALDMVDTLQPDVVLMDIAMPKMSGIEATRAIKAKHPEVTVLILSMYDSEEYVLPILKAGAAGYVLKRSAARELVTALKAAVQGSTILHPDVARTVLGRTSPSPVQAPAPRKGEPSPEVLTEREREVLVLIAKGLTNQQIAQQLFISVKTVQAHRANIMEKLDLHDAVELTKYALRQGLLALNETD